MYRVFLEGEQIGTTDLESGDPPMGGVFGKLRFSPGIAAFTFLRDYCTKSGIEIDILDEAKGSFSTRHIPALVVRNETDQVIEGVGGVNIEGMESEHIIAILGVPYPFYGDEFPNHVKKYQEQLRLPT